MATKLWGFSCMYTQFCFFKHIRALQSHSIDNFPFGFNNVKIKVNWASMEIFASQGWSEV